MTRKYKKRILLIAKIIIVFLLLGVIYAFGYKTYKDYKQEIEDAEITIKLQTLLNTNIKLYEEIIPEDSTETITRLEVSNNDLLVANVEYIGVVEIPSIGIKKPVVQGITRKDIASKVGWETHSATPGMGGNVVLAAHNAANYFGNIYQLSNNDNIIVTTRNGIYTYKVFDKFKVHKTEVWVYNELKEYTETITLITCVYPDNNYRWIIRGELIKKESL